MSITPKSRQQIFNDLQAYLQSLAPELTDFNVGSVLNSILDAPAAEMEQLWNALVAAFSAAYVGTAEGEDLDNKVADFGLERNKATYATGFVTFGRSTPFNQDFIIPVGTIVQTPSSTTEAGVQFATTALAVLPANQLNVSSVPIKALNPGASGNVAANAISVISSPPAGIETVINPAPTAGGTDEESDEDLKARVPLYLNSLARGTKAALESAALSVTGVSSVSIVENVPTPGFVQVYVADASGQATTDLLKAVQEKLELYRPVAVMVNAYAPIAMYIDIKCWILIQSGYSPSAVIANVKTAVTDFLSRLKLGEYVYRSELIKAITEVDGVKSVNTLVENYISNELHNCALDLVTNEFQTSSSSTEVNVAKTPFSVTGVYLAYDLGKTGTNYYLGASSGFDKRKIVTGTILPIVNYKLTVDNGGIKDLSTLILPYKATPGPFSITPGSITSNGIWTFVDAFTLSDVYFTGTGLDDLTATGTYTSDKIRYYRIQIDNASGIRFYGSGLNNMTVDGSYTASAIKNFRIQIDSVGSPDTFRWSNNGGLTWNATNVPITGSAQALSDGVEITFASTTGHTLNDYWEFTPDTFRWSDDKGKTWKAVGIPISTLVQNLNYGLQIQFSKIIGHTLNDYWEFTLIHNLAGTNYGDGAIIDSDGVTVSLSTSLPLGTTEVYVQYQEDITGGANTQTDVLVDYETQYITVSNLPVADVEGIWLSTDTSHLETNYYIDGTFEENSGKIILGTKTPNVFNEPVIVSYWQDIGKKGLKPYANVIVPGNRVARARTIDVNIE